jgi:hypothetical protein
MLASSAALRDARRRVSHLVSDVEHRLDVRVLERSRRGVSLPHNSGGGAQSVFRSVKIACPRNSISPTGVAKISNFKWSVCCVVCCNSAEQ